MKKLIQGIVEFRKSKLPNYEDVFAKLALGQFPDALFIACSDSRVAANVFASTDPGDLFVVRNVGNCVPCCNEIGHSSSDESEAAAIEFALSNLNVRDIIVCGHSECGAILAIVNGREKVGLPNLKSWLRHSEKALLPENLKKIKSPPKEHHNHVSQANVLMQLKSLKTYPIVKERLLNGTLRLHAWWFEIKTVGVYAYDENSSEFKLIDETGGAELIKKFNY